MDGDLNVIPPDKDIFEKKKISTKQREHLAKAREKAKATMDRRKMLDEQKKDEEVEEEVSEEEEAPASVKKPKPTKKAKKPTPAAKRVETEEEGELRRFEKFMKSMSKYEQLKVQHTQEIEEAKKVKLSLDQDEYERLVALVKADEAKRELEKKSPVDKPKKEVDTKPSEAPLVRHMTNYNHRRAKRFGSE